MRFGLLIRDFEFHTAVDDIAFQPVQTDDFLIAVAVAEILLGDCPEGVAMHHGVDAVVIGGFRACHGKCRGLDRRHDGVPAGFILVDDRTVTADLDHIPAELLYPAGNGFATIIGAARDGHEVANMKCASGLDRVGRLDITAESCRDLGCKIAHTGIHPVAGAAFVRKPSVNSQNHLVRFRGVVQRLGLIAQPEQLGFAVAPADIGAKLDESAGHEFILEKLWGDIIVKPTFLGDGSVQEQRPFLNLLLRFLIRYCSVLPVPELLHCFFPPFRHRWVYLQKLRRFAAGAYCL